MSRKIAVINNEKSIFWVSSSLDELCSFPKEVRRNIGYALHFAQHGEKHPSAKPLKGFGGAGVLEVVEDFNRSTYRAVYTIRFMDSIYVLLAFQKKTIKGIETPKHILELIKQRLRAAEDNFKKASHEKNNKKFR